MQGLLLAQPGFYLSLAEESGHGSGISRNPTINKRSYCDIGEKMLLCCHKLMLKMDLTGYVFHKSVTNLTHNGAANLSDSRHISGSNNG